MIKVSASIVPHKLLMRFRFRVCMPISLLAIAYALLGSSHQLLANDSYFAAPSVADLTSIGSIGDFGLSPDGRSFTYVYKDAIYTAELLNNHGALRRATGAEPRWSPDGRTIAFYCTKEDGLQICLLEVTSGAVRQLTGLRGGIVPDEGIAANGGSSLDFAWSDDSAKIVFATKPISPTSRTTTNPNQIDPKQPLVFSGESNRSAFLNLPGFPDGPGTWAGCGALHTWENFAADEVCDFTQLFVVDVQTGSVAQVTRGPEHHFQPIWSADSRFLICVTVAGRRKSPLQMPPTHIVEINLATGTEKVIASGPESKIRPSRSPDGKLVAYEEGGLQEYVPWSLHVITTGGRIVLDTRHVIDRNVVDYAWSRNSKTIFLNVRDGVRQGLKRLDVETQNVTEIPLQTNWVTAFAAGPNNAIAFVAEDGQSCNEIRVWNANGGRVQGILKVNPEIDNWKLGKQRIVQWRNSRGEELEGVLVLPTTFAKGQTYPLIVDMRGTTSCDCLQRDPWDANQLLAQHGYAIFFPILRPFYYPFLFVKGNTFHRFRDPRQAIDLIVDNVTSGVLELFKQGVTQPGRVALLV